MGEIKVKTSLLYPIRQFNIDGVRTRVVSYDSLGEVQNWTEWKDYHVCIGHTSCIRCGKELQ